MKVLVAAAEASPFCKTGGLGEVIGSLPSALREVGIDVRVILPNYSSIPEDLRREMRLIKVLSVPLSWRTLYCGLLELEYHGMTFYFIDNEYFFKRSTIYDQYDEAERFAFFSRAVLEALPALDFSPDIIHSHDWQTAMISVFLKTLYKRRKKYAGIKTVFTIHNLHYQGIFPHVVLADILGLNEKYFNSEQLEFFGQVNYLKGGLVFSDRLTTVSCSYAAEIQTPFFGEKLDGLLRKRSAVLSGIVNGIENVNYKYSTTKKKQNKLALQKELQLNPDPNLPMIAIISRLVPQKGFDLIECVLAELMELNLQIVVIGSGLQAYEQMLQNAASRYPDKLAVVIGYEDVLARKVYAGADIYLMPSLFEPCGIGQMIAMAFGCVPVVRFTGGLIDTVKPFDPSSCEGYGFGFTNYNAHEMLFAVKQAVECYYDKVTWDNIVRKITGLDFSWKQSAAQYHALYSDLLKK